MTRLLISLFMLLAIAAPADAHKLKVFVAVAGDTITGYAFFIGGGRPHGVPWTAKDARGEQLASGLTDSDGRFAFERPDKAVTDITVTVDTREAHIASATLSAARLGVASVPTPTSVSQPPTRGTRAQSPSDAEITALVEGAVQRQVEPLLERFEAMDTRLRFVDVLSGVFLILGLAGMALWAQGRRR